MTFENWNLNKQQEKIVYASNNESSLIISGAGTGKTRVLVFRIIYLIKHFKVNPNRILAITFSNKATKEMKNRIEKELNSEINLPWVNTFHSFCYKILKQEIHHLGYSPDFSIVDDEDKKTIFQMIYQNENLARETLKIDKTIYYVEEIKRRNVSVQSFLEEYKIVDKLSKDACKLLIVAFEKYNSYLKENKYLDFYDLLNFTYKLFKENPEIIRHWSEKFDYILIDEFQDTDDTQYYIVTKIAKKNNIFVVGDPDQSIYGWRGAKPENMEIFKKDFPESNVYYLEENYRSTQEILNVANDIISKNKSVFTKTLFSKNKNGSKPKYFEAANSDLESTWIVKKIKELVDEKKKMKYKDITILYRSNFLSRNIEQILLENRIPYFIYGGIKFYQRKEIKDLIAYLKAINNNDELSIIRILNIPSRRIGDNSIKKIRTYADKHNINIYQAMKEIISIKDINSQAIKGVINFLELIDSMKNKISQTQIKPSELLLSIIEKTNYKNLYTNSNEIDRINNINELVNSITNFEIKNENATLNDYLESIQLFIDNDEEANKIDSVKLMTIHTSKGLEFNCVFIMGLNENIFPSIRINSNQINEESKIQEERRIMYVALTRAKNELFLSSSTGLDFFNNLKLPSRFISEIDSDNIDKINKISFQNINNYDDDWFDSKKKVNYQNNYYDFVPEYMLHEEIQHTVFGSGVVIKIKEKTIVVAFKPQFGTKEIVKNHKSIIRKT